MPINIKTPAGGGVILAATSTASDVTLTLPAVTSTVLAQGAIDNITSINTGQIAGMRNKIINGAMDISQRGTSFAAIAPNTYSLDRYSWFTNSTGVVTVSQQADAPVNNEFQSSLRIAVTTADATVGSGEVSFMQQIIEGYNVRDLIGKTFTLSFWVRSSKTGVHCIALKNSGLNRAYVVEYTVISANTWEQKSISVSGGLITTGTWDWTNGKGLLVVWTLAAGTTFQTTAGSWQTGDLYATSSQVNCLDTIGNIFAITGVQLEVGSVATPFEHRPYGAELALCQRYYVKFQGNASNNARIGAGYVVTATSAVVANSLPVAMRIAPTALEQSGTAGHYGVLYANSGVACTAVPTFGSASETQVAVLLTVAAGLTAGQGCHGYFLTTGSGYIGWSAEL